MNYEKAIRGLDLPYYGIDSVKGAFVEFAVESYDDLYKEFAERTAIIKDNGYDSYEDFDGYLAENDDEYLDIYITAREDGSARAVIKISDAANAYSVPLSDEEQKELYAFISDYCDKHMNASLDEMFEEAREVVEEEFDESRDTGASSHSNDKKREDNGKDER